MQSFSLLMIIIAIIAFIVGMIFPKTFKFILRTKNNRKNIFLVCLGVFIVFCIAMYIFSIGTPVLASNKPLTNDNQAKITGKGAYADSKVRFYQGDIVLEELQADGKGYFSVDVKLMEGQNKFKADSTNEKGKTQVGGSLIITLDTSAPSLSLEQPQSPVEKNKFTLKGKSEKKAKILVLSGDKEIKSKRLSKDNFEISNIQLSEGENKFTIKAVDEADNYSQPIEVVLVYNKPIPAPKEEKKEESKTADNNTNTSETKAEKPAENTQTNTPAVEPPKEQTPEPQKTTSYLDYINEQIGKVGNFEVTVLDASSNVASPQTSGHVQVIINTPMNQFNCTQAKFALFDLNKNLYTDSRLKDKISRVLYSSPGSLRSSYGLADSTIDWASAGATNFWNVMLQYKSYEDESGALENRTWGVSINGCR